MIAWYSHAKEQFEKRHKENTKCRFQTADRYPQNRYLIIFRHMKGKRLLWMGILCWMALAGCASVKPLPAGTKYSASLLRSDFDLFQAMLEEAHPGLYWYTSKDSMQQRFGQARSLIKDSLTETGFRNVLSYALSGIGCGHTTLKPSKAYLKATRGSNRFFSAGAQAVARYGFCGRQFKQKRQPAYTGRFGACH